MLVVHFEQARDAEADMISSCSSGERDQISSNALHRLGTLWLAHLAAQQGFALVIKIELISKLKFLVLVVVVVVFEMFSTGGLIYLILRCATLIIIALIQVQVCGLPKLPDSLRADSQLLYITEELAQMYYVDEYIDRLDGSVRLTVANVSDSDKGDDVIDYFRIKEHIKDYDPLNDKVVAYNSDQSSCKADHLGSWYLFELSHILSELFYLKDLASGETRNDRTSIGPIALLRLVYESAHLFRLDSKAFDEVNLCDTYYFSYQTNLNPGSPQQVDVKLIAALPVQHTESDSQIKMGQTLLSQIESKVHLSKIALIFADNKAGPNDDQIKRVSADLLDFTKSRLGRLIVSYDLIQERSLSKHSGAKGGQPGGSNPFALPAGIGCGLVSDHNPFYVSARQFSGQYEADDFSDSFYMAYDEKTNQLRYDSLGEHKIIYSLNEKRAVIVADSSGAPRANSTNQANQGIIFDQLHEDQNHCSQSYYHPSSEVDQNGLFQAKKMDEILGLGERSALLYLGTETLEDGTLSHLFEREIIFAQIPTISYMHMRLNGRPSNRFFLVFHFVAEQIGGRQLFEPDAYRSMWLKRIELNSLNNLFKYNFINSRITFNKFSWSLEMEAEETRNREGKLRHPVRTFDTIECRSLYGQSKLEVLLRQSKDSEWFELDEGRFSKSPRDSPFEVARVDLEGTIEANLLELEEGLMGNLVERTSLARSEINNLELITSRNPNSILLRADLTSPMNYKFDQYLLGWVKAVESILHDKVGRITKRKNLMARHECALSLDTLLSGDTIKYHMMYCPNIGCGYIDNIDRADYIKNDGDNEKKPPQLDIYFHMCEIYVRQKQVDSKAAERTIYSSEAIKRSLLAEPISVDIEQVSKRVVKNFRATVTKVFLTSGSGRGDWDELLVSGSCYTPNSRPSGLSRGSDPQVHVVQLNFDKHHSRVHCHKACLIYPFCETYTYNKLTRRCSLSNISRSMAASDQATGALEDNMGQLDNLENGQQCSLYALNPLFLYGRKREIRFTTPAYLERNFNFTTIASASECANFCRRNELNPSNRRQDHCLGFDFLRQKSVCAPFASSSTSHFDGRKPQLPAVQSVDSSKILISRDEFERRIGSTDLYQAYEVEAYQRDYSQHYIRKSMTRININEPGDAMIGSPRSAKITSVLYDIDQRACLRECSILQTECVSVNHCQVMLDKRFTQFCELYNIRSPFVFNPEAPPSKMDRSKLQYLAGESQLTPLEESFYFSNSSEAYLVSTSKSSCVHYYLQGDELYLKRQLAEAAGDDWAENALIQTQTQQDLAISLNFTSIIGNLVKNLDLDKPSRALSLGSQLLVSLSIGLLLFFLQPKIADTIAGFQGFDAILTRLRPPRQQRSASRVEFNEMVDIGID